VQRSSGAAPAPNKLAVRYVQVLVRQSSALIKIGLVGNEQSCSSRLELQLVGHFRHIRPALAP